MDLNKKAPVRFETMPGKQGQMDWGFFEDHLVYEDGTWKKLYCFLMILGYSRMMKNPLEILDDYPDRTVAENLNIVEGLDRIFSEEGKDGPMRSRFKGSF